LTRGERALLISDRRVTEAFSISRAVRVVSNTFLKYWQYQYTLQNVLPIPIPFKEGLQYQYQQEGQHPLTGQRAPPISGGT